MTTGECAVLHCSQPAKVVITGRIVVNGLGLAVDVKVCQRHAGIG